MADWRKIKKIDAHIHIIPDVVHKANPDAEDEWVYADQTKYLELMDKYNIEKVIIMPLNDPYLMSMEFTVDAVNKNLKEMKDKYHDKFYAMADVDTSNTVEVSKRSLIKAIEEYMSFCAVGAAGLTYAFFREEGGFCEAKDGRRMRMYLKA